MSFSLGDLFGSSDLPYPTGRTGASPPSCGSAPAEAPEADGFFNRLFAPKDLAYPLPACPVTPPGGVLTATGAGVSGASGAPPIVAVGAPVAPAVGAAVVSGVAPSSVASPSSGAAVSEPVTASPAPVAPASPITLIIAPWGGSPVAGSAPASIAPAPAVSAVAAPAAAAPAPTAPAPAPVATAPAPAAAAPVSAPAPVAVPILAPAPMPPADCPAQPPQKIVTACSLNPRLRARHPRAQEVYLEEVLEEKITARMLTKDAPPVAFVVPDGCNAVDLYTLPIEVTPEVGCVEDLDLVVTVGELKIGRNVCDGDRPLAPGDQIAVTAPWRHASWVELAPDHLRLPIVARFYQTA